MLLQIVLEPHRFKRTGKNIVPWNSDIMWELGQSMGARITTCPNTRVTSVRDGEAEANSNQHKLYIPTELALTFWVGASVPLAE